MRPEPVDRGYTLKQESARTIKQDSSSSAGTKKSDDGSGTAFTTRVRADRCIATRPDCDVYLCAMFDFQDNYGVGRLGSLWV